MAYPEKLRSLCRLAMLVNAEVVWTTQAQAVDLLAKVDAGKLTEGEAFQIMRIFESAATLVIELFDRSQQGGRGEQGREGRGSSEQGGREERGRGDGKKGDGGTQTLGWDDLPRGKPLMKGPYHQGADLLANVSAGAFPNPAGTYPSDGRCLSCMRAPGACICRTGLC